MFAYNVRSQFNVTIFDMTVAEIEYPYSLHTFHCHETHHAQKRWLVRIRLFLDILEDIPSRQKLKEKNLDMVDHSCWKPRWRTVQQKEREASPSFTREDQSKDIFRYVNLVLWVLSSMHKHCKTNCTIKLLITS